MLISAVRLGLSGLLTLRGDGASSASQTALVVSPEEAAAKAVEAALHRVEKSHGRAVKTHAAVQVAVAMLILYVVSAIFTLDPRGRWLALLAGWVGVGYHLANAMFGLLVLRPEILRVAPEMLARLSAVLPGGKVDQPMLNTFRALSVLMPLLAAVFGILFCAVIIVFFGGQRGRRLYGLEAGVVSAGDAA